MEPSVTPARPPRAVRTPQVSAMRRSMGRMRPSKRVDNSSASHTANRSRRRPSGSSSIPRRISAKDTTVKNVRSSSVSASHAMTCGSGRGLTHSEITLVSSRKLTDRSHAAHPWFARYEGPSCATEMRRRTRRGAKFEVSQRTDTVLLTTDILKVELSLKWGSVQYSTIRSDSLLRERDSIPRTYDPTSVNGEKTFHVEDRFSPDFDEGFYGLGQHQSGMFNYRGSTVELGQNNTDVAIPLLLSSKGYALMWNTASLTYVDNRFPLELNLDSLAGHSIDYYFIYGPELDSIIHEYRSLTGHTPLLPKWAYGFFQSKDRYVSQDEVLGIADRYRKAHI